MTLLLIITKMSTRINLQIQILVFVNQELTYSMEDLIYATNAQIQQFVKEVIFKNILKKE